MPNASAAITTLPASAVAALRAFGEDLKVARQRRGESLRAWALRMNVSVPTLVRMEKGDAAVGIGVYVTALYLMQRHKALGEVARPEADSAALAAEIAKAGSARRPSKLGIMPRIKPSPKPEKLNGQE